MTVQWSAYRGAQAHDKDPMRAHAIRLRRERGHGGNWRRKTVEVVVQIFLSDSQRLPDNRRSFL